MGWLFLWVQQIFAVGDAGALTDRQVQLYERFWRAHAQPNDLLIWLGDNLYPAGHRETPRDRRRWRRVVAVSRAFPGVACATPGNHDWKAGIEGLHRQAKDIPHYPAPGSSEPETLSAGIWRLCFIDSELFIRSGGRTFRWQRLDSLLSTFPPDALVLIVLHHPPRTAGAHGGSFPFTAHLFPLRILSPYLYVPLPLLGTLLIWVRKYARHPTDLSYPAYAMLAESLLVRASRIPQPLFLLSGHEHNLQVHRIEPKKWALVSGSGCKTEPVARRKALWARSVVGLWKLTPTSLEAYALVQPTHPIWKYTESAVP
ncbi:MAG: metallophosphoesterase [Bacteroidia bacterium]|nr:metallophosphoesterase [Bacteroidia bacterium]MDW8015910.1 metallophosphoesterase [Bacteroidia bacterium]